MLDGVEVKKKKRPEGDNTAWLYFFSIHLTSIYEINAFYVLGVGDTAENRNGFSIPVEFMF